MIWRITNFKKTQILIQDVIFGASWGMIWSSLLMWSASQLGFPSPLSANASMLLAGVAGAVFGLLAGVKFCRTTGDAQEYRNALKAYGRATARINTNISVLLIGVVGFGNDGAAGLFAGLVIGYAVAPVGNLLSFLYFVVFHKVVSRLLDALSIVNGGAFDVAWTLASPSIDGLFKVVEFICTRLKLCPSERLTGISTPMQHYERGMSHDKKRRLMEAILEYERAVELQPDFTEAWNNLGYDYGQIMNIDKEIESYKKALEIKPEYEYPMINLAIAYVHFGYPDKARPLLLKLSELWPDKYYQDIDDMILAISKSPQRRCCIR